MVTRAVNHSADCPNKKKVRLSMIMSEMIDCGASFMTDGPAPFQNAATPKQRHQSKRRGLIGDDFKKNKGKSYNRVCNLPSC